MTQRYRYQKLWPVQFFEMTRAERDALQDPPNFLCIINSDDSELQLYANNTWNAIAKYAPGGSADIYGQLHNFDDDTVALEVRRTQIDPVPTLDPATSGWMELPPIDHTQAASSYYRVQIDNAGSEATATFKWSDDDGASWEATGLSMVDADGNPITIELQAGIIIKFGLGDYTLDDLWRWYVIGTASQLYDLRVDTTNSRVDVGTTLRIANDPYFYLNLYDATTPWIRFAQWCYLLHARANGQVGLVIPNYAGDGGKTAISFQTDPQDVPLIFATAIRLTPPAATPDTPPDDQGNLYAKVVGGLARPHWQDETGAETNLLLPFGATPGGELGGTWPSPTVDATHSGSAHHDAVTLAAGGQHTLSGQEITSVAATASQAGHATATQITKLDGIEAAADVTDATNVAAAGAVMASLADALGDTFYASADDTVAKLAGQITTTRKFLRQTGTGAVSAAPAWDTIASADVPDVHAGSAHSSYVTKGTWVAKGDIVGATGISSPAALTVGADGTMIVADASQSLGIKWAAAYITHTLPFTPDAAALAADNLNPRAFCVGESGEHGTFTAFRAKAVAGTPGTGTNTIIIEADDNPAFTSATEMFTLNLGTSTEVDDTSTPTWAAGDIFVRARCSAVGATAPLNVIVFLYFKEQVYA